MFFGSYGKPKAELFLLYAHGCSKAIDNFIACVYNNKMQMICVLFYAHADAEEICH